MPWVRAIWVENEIEEEGVVPKSWIQEKTVRWPNKVNVMRAFNEQREPLEDWFSFPLIKIKLTSEEKEDCEAFEFTTSNETSDEEEGGEEERAREIRDNVQRSKSSKGGCSSGLPPLPIFHSTPTQKNRIPNYRPASRVERPTSPLAGLSISSCSRQSSTERSKLQMAKRKSNDFVSLASPERKKSRQDKHQSVATSSKDPSPPSLFPISEARFQKMVLRLLTEIRDSVQRVGKRVEPADSDFHLVQMTKMEEFSELEDNLLDIEKKKILVSRILKIGGCNVKVNVRKIMSRLMTNELMSTFNMDGHRKKTAFRTTALFEIIKESVLKNFTSSESEITAALQRCLKYAPDRKGGDRVKPRTNNND